MIRVHDLHKSYRAGASNHEVLRGLSFDVADGEFVALLGRSGSGKSTLLNCLAGIETYDRGVVQLDGTDLGPLDDDARTRLRRTHIGIVFQFFNLLPVLSVIDNILLPAELSGRADSAKRQRAVEHLEELGLGDRLHALPDQLSGGEQQRVAIVRALVNQPRILLADEPTGNLDSSTGEETLELLKKINVDHGMTIVMATHSHQAAEAATRVVRLVDGSIVEAS